LHFTTISSCSAKNAGGFDIRSPGHDFVVSNHTVVTACRAELFGALYRASGGSFHMVSTNISHSHATECVGALEAKSGHLSFQFFVLHESSARAHNGGICVREMASFEITLSLFSGCRHRSAESEAGAAMLIYECPYRATIKNSLFLNNSHDATTTVTVASGHRLSCSGCCFSGDKYRELNLKVSCMDNCVFDGSCPIIELETARGFDTLSTRARQLSPTPAMAKPRSMPVQHGFMILLIATGISLGSASIITVLHHYIQAMCLASLKIPKALQ
jgi:hypothetical protein